MDKLWITFLRFFAIFSKLSISPNGKFFEIPETFFPERFCKNVPRKTKIEEVYSHSSNCGTFFIISSAFAGISVPTVGVTTSSCLSTIPK